MALDTHRVLVSRNSGSGTLDLGTAAARVYEPPLRCLGVTSALSDGGHVELLFKVTGCHGLNECLLLVSVARDSEATLVAELPVALRSTVERHQRENA